MGHLKVFGLQRVVFRNVIHGERMAMTLFPQKKKRVQKQCAKSNSYFETRIENQYLRLMFILRTIKKTIK
ncbi:MAG: hypothetical protein FD181_1166 [Prolixibacteraceae bacterium]|nr:MAG: hypothetical protein FD181_1166 [Prolixibacteraceae bacterium]